MKKILITGITGFAGSFLAEELVKKKDAKILGTYISDKSLGNISSIHDALHLTKVDLASTQAVDDLLRKNPVDELYHLAALPSPADSYQNPQLYIHNNIDVQLNILESLLKSKAKTKILIVSSAEIYGAIKPSDLPLNESTTFRPTSPYSVSKAAQDLLALQYFLSHKMNIVRVRPFNHIGPRQSPAFVVPAFAKQIADIEYGKQEPVLKVGNLDARRDFTDVRDMVKAYTLIMEKGSAGDVYNIGHGESTPIREILDHLVSLSKVTLVVKTDPARLRPSDIPDFVSDNTKLMQLTGWQPEIPLEQSLKDTLEYWRGQAQ